MGVERQQLAEEAALAAHTQHNSAHSSSTIFKRDTFNNATSSTSMTRRETTGAQAAVAVCHSLPLAVALLAVAGCTATAHWQCGPGACGHGSARTGSGSR